MSQSHWIGKTIGGRYQIQELLGQGGMSAVYKANDPNLRRVVAVKLIHSHLSSDSEFVRRFEEEAAAVAQLRHANIIQVYDFNHDDDTYFIVFEFVPGESLQGRLQRISQAERTMPFSETIQITASIADALEYAHKRGLVHRDIKPANIMLNVHGEAILMDFGIVKIVGGDSHTATGAVLGTARYISPEQIRGEQVSSKADIYSLGIALYEMISGRPPFEAQSAMSLMMMHVNDPVPDLRRVRPDVPPDLFAVIYKALDKDPAKRFRTAGEMAAALRAVRLDGPTITPQATVPDATVREQAPDREPVRQATSRQPQPQAGRRQPQTGQHPSRTGRRQVQTQVPRSTETFAAPPQPRQRNMTLIGGSAAAAIAVLCIAVVGILFATGVIGGGDKEEAVAVNVSPAIVEEIAQEEATAEVAVEEVTLEPVETATTTASLPTATLEATATLAPIDEPTSAPTEEPTPTLIPTQTSTPIPPAPTGPYVQINAITIGGDAYVVDYSPIGYTPALPNSTHIHFFWNTVPQVSAGAGPSAMSWILYGGPNPFTQYTVGDRPSGATQMCALVANPDHTIQPNTGNCVDLPG